MAKSKIYTRSGDGGLTSLAGGKRVPKTNVRIEAYGTVDELNSFVGLLIEEVDDLHDKDFLKKIQNGLFMIGGYLATESGSDQSDCPVKKDVIDRLEKEIDEIDGTLPPLKQFILPGGCKAASVAHICRTISRRAERCVYKVNENEPLSQGLFQYINRLSDYFFILARKLSLKSNGQENIWHNSWE